ncbi:MAG TPA: glycosyltransferase, partial [Polyangiaceae bacterium]|nr:glycosyltransferase [Polyangiaceae bacterium]
RSNILRAAVLYEQGGIYLDLDTVTLSSLRPLLNSPQFLGYEHIVWPYFVIKSRSPLLKLKSEALSIARTICRLLPAGYRVFRKLSPLYYECVNGAIAGGVARAPLMASYLRAMLRVPRERQLQPHALGTYLLQEIVGGYTGDDLQIHGPDVFYPLAPEVSEHWFRIVERVDLADVVRPTTRVVHWYASVRTRELLPKISPSYVKMHASRQLYSALVAPFVEVPGDDSARDGIRPSVGSA